MAFVIAPSPKRILERLRNRIGLYGGSFDPIHFGHLISARSIAEQLALSRVLLIPSPRPPHKHGRPLTDARHRLEMARLAVEGDALFEVSGIEIDRPGPSYTIDTVAALREQMGPDSEFFWIIGADSLPELPTWRRISELVRMVQIVTATRPGWQPPDLGRLAEAVGQPEAEALLRFCVSTPAIEISSTGIRARVTAAWSIRYLVPEAVASYIQSASLYAK